MKAMILAAGLGTRLRPLTDNLPKALIKIRGVTLLEWTIRRLQNAGCREIIVNTHHFPEQISDFLRQKNDFGIRIEISREEALLDTGGGLQKASWFFDDDKPFLLHNVDALTDLDLRAMHAAHIRTGALATLAVRDRQTSRYLLFDENATLCGWESRATGETVRTRPRPVGIGETQSLSFMGIHLISPRIFSLLVEKGAFAILPAYLRLAGAGERIVAFRGDAARWLDCGRRENLGNAVQILGEDFFEPDTIKKRQP